MRKHNFQLGKSQNLFICLFIFVIIFNIGCKLFSNKGENKMENFSKMLDQNPVVSETKDAPIPYSAYSEVKNCFQLYLDTMATHGFDTLFSHRALTRKISFGSEALIEWLNQVCDNNNTNTARLELRFIIYSDKYLSAMSVVHHDKYLGKIGVILWPVDNHGSDAMSSRSNTQTSGYDLGNLHP